MIPGSGVVFHQNGFPHDPGDLFICEPYSQVELTRWQIYQFEGTERICVREVVRQEVHGDV